MPTTKPTSKWKQIEVMLTREKEMSDTASCETSTRKIDECKLSISVPFSAHSHHQVYSPSRLASTSSPLLE
jgi:hypothetical protein